MQCMQTMMHVAQTLISTTETLQTAVTLILQLSCQSEPRLKFLDGHRKLSCYSD